MPIGRIGGNSNSVPDLNELDSNPQSVASATGNEPKTGGIGHRAVQLLRNLSSSIRQVADSFANAIEHRFSGSAKDNLKSLFNRGPKHIDTPVELKTFKNHIDDTYAQVASPGFENSTYGDVGSNHLKDGDYAQADESIYASLSEVTTRSTSDQPIYANTGETAPTDTFEPIYQNIGKQAQDDDYIPPAGSSDEYIEAAPEEVYASLSEVATESLYGELSNISTDSFGGFKPDASQPADTKLHSRVDSNSPQALKESLGFIKYVLDNHGASGGKALADTGIFRNKKVIGQITPELFNFFQNKLKEVKSANAAKVAAGFGVSASQAKYEKYNSDNADSPIHAVLEKAVFASSPKLANKVKWEFDQILARGASGASPEDIALSTARQVVGEKLKESYDAGRSDSPLHPLLANSSLANESESKLESIRADYDQTLTDAAINFAYEGGLDQPFNPDAFKDQAIAAAKATIEKYSF